MIISELAKQVSNEHLFYLIAKAARYGYHIHEEFIAEFDKRAEHINIEHYPMFDIDFSELEARVMAHIGCWDMLTKRPSRLRDHINVKGTITGRFPSRPNIDSSLGFKLNV